MSSMVRNRSFGPDKPKGSITTEFNEIDCILSEIWRKITNGAEGDPKQIANAFVLKYKKYIFTSDEFKVGKITLQDLIETCRVNTCSAPGIDGWHPKDLALLSDNALQLIADLMNMIEDGAEWPDSTKIARAVFLPKDPDDIQNPLAYRILKITSGIYRRWGTTRNRQLEEWISKWDLPAINAGVPGKGAQDAWYITALMNEYNKLLKQDTAGASIDVYKCFDQINRPLVYKLAEMAGMPKRKFRGLFQIYR